VGAVLYLLGRTIAAAVVGAIGATLLALGLVAPKTYVVVTDALRRAGVALGRLISAVILTLLYALVFVPAGLMARVRGSDELALARSTMGRSVFVDVPVADEASLFERQFTRESSLRAPSRMPRWVRVLRLVFVTVVAFVMVDFVAWTAGRQAWFAFVGPLADSRAETAPYRGTDWGRDYWREFREAFSVDYRPYVGWQRRDYAGEHVTIEDGVRATWAPAEPTGAPARIFVLGGSTVWGTGARDEGTIPSWLARIAHEQGEAYEVTNLGESGFVSWQEALLLADKCASNDIPDVAVFYDGVNDVFAKMQSPDTPRPPQNLDRSRRWFAAFRDRYQPLEGVITFYERNSLLATLLQEASTPSFAGAARGAEWLAQRIAEDHARTRAFVRALAEANGFEVIHVWQPSVFTKDPLSIEEETHAEKPGDFPPDLLRSTYRLATREVVASGEVIDASHVFDGVEDTVFIDWMHVSEDGNRRVAELIGNQLDATGVTNAQGRGGTR
jgi:hypothetical protein